MLCGRVVHWLLRGGTTAAPLAIVTRGLKNELAIVSESRALNNEGSPKSSFCLHVLIQICSDPKVMCILS